MPPDQTHPKMLPGDCIRNKRKAERGDTAIQRICCCSPSPTIRPCEGPSASVLRMHIIPAGPIGTAIANPIIRPFKKKTSSISLSTHELVAVEAARKMFPAQQGVHVHARSGCDNISTLDRHSGGRMPSSFIPFQKPHSSQLFFAFSISILNPADPSFKLTSVESNFCASDGFMSNLPIVPSRIVCSP